MDFDLASDGFLGIGDGHIVQIYSHMRDGAQSDMIMSPVVLPGAEGVISARKKLVQPQEPYLEIVDS